MPALSKQRHFEVLRTALALAEERTVVELEDAARAVGLDPTALRDLLAPVLYLEFRTGSHDLVSESGEFLLTEDGRLMVTERHWLRDLAAAPPDPDTALRLLVSGLAMQSFATEPTPDLDRALRKLRELVAAQLRITVEAPPQLPVAQQAWRDGRSLRFRYLADGAAAATEREAVPYRVYCKWGHWYYQGRQLDETEPKQFRVDRMLQAELGDVAFDPPPDTEIPDWFDLSAHEQTVTLRLTREQLAALPRPHRVERESPLGAGRVEADVTVIGDRRLEYLLVCLDPDVEVAAPATARELQHTHAAGLLDAYD
ncbi:MAG TPA: WYL domain-containing protein [Acidimicrobiia bacterium]|nr:WYL domain-containing protein [Acidimicrobiia bacterium]